MIALEIIGAITALLASAILFTVLGTGAIRYFDAVDDLRRIRAAVEVIAYKDDEAEEDAEEVKP